MKETLNVAVADGKYTVIGYEDGSSTALRWGEAWPAFKNNRPDNLHMALAREVADLREAAKTKVGHKAAMAAAGFAFPSRVVKEYVVAGSDGHGVAQHIYEEIPGMTLRQHYAGQALAGIVSDRSFLPGPEGVAARAFDYADALIAFEANEGSKA